MSAFTFSLKLTFNYACIYINICIGNMTMYHRTQRGEHIMLYYIKFRNFALFLIIVNVLVV